MEVHLPSYRVDHKRAFKPCLDMIEKGHDSIWRRYDRCFVVMLNGMKWWRITNNNIMDNWNILYYIIKSSHGNLIMPARIWGNKYGSRKGGINHKCFLEDIFVKKMKKFLEVKY